MRIVAVPDDARRLPVHTEVAHPLTDITTRARPGGPRRIGERIPFTHPLARGQRRIHRRKWVNQNHCRLPLADIVGDVRHLVSLHRRRQRYQDCIDVRRNREFGVDLHHLVLFAKLVYHRPLGKLLIAREILAAKDLSHGVDHAHPFPNATGDYTDRPHHFVLSRQSTIEKWNHLLFSTSGECHPHEHFRDP